MRVLWPFCERHFGNFIEALSEMERKNGNCLRAQPEFYHFSAMSLAILKISKPKESKRALIPGLPSFGI